MNKGDLVEAISEKAGLDKRSAETALNAFIHSVMEAVTAGDKVSIPGFGSFSPTSRAARTGRNPQTGAPVQIAASRSVRFAPGSAFKSAVNAGGGSG